MFFELLLHVIGFGHSFHYSHSIETGNINSLNISSMKTGLYSSGEVLTSVLIGPLSTQ